jgi:hypothetical protein
VAWAWSVSVVDRDMRHLLSLVMGASRTVM